MPVPSFPDIARILTLVDALEPRSILLVGIGWGELPAALRFACDARHGRLSRREWQCRIDGLEPCGEFESALWPQLLDRFEIGNPIELLPDQGRYDLIVLRHVLEGMTREDGAKLVEAARKLTPRVLVVAAQSLEAWPAPPNLLRFSRDCAIPVTFTCWTDADFNSIERATPDPDEVLVTLLDGERRRQPAAIPRLAALSVVVWVGEGQSPGTTLEALARQTLPPQEIRIAGPGAIADDLARFQAAIPVSVVVTSSPDPGFALAEASLANQDGAVAVLVAGAIPHPDWIAALDVAFLNRLLALAGGPVLPEWVDTGRPPQWWHDGLRGPAMLLDAGSSLRMLDLAAGEAPSPAAFGVRASLVSSTPASCTAKTLLEAVRTLTLSAHRDGFQALYVPATSTKLVLGSGGIDAGALINTFHEAVARARESAREARTFLCAPDWDGTAWQSALLAYLAAFEPDAPVSLVMLAAESGNITAVGDAVLATVAEAGLDPDAIPDVIIQPSSFDTANLLAWIGRSSAVLSVGGQAETSLIELATREGRQVQAGSMLGTLIAPGPGHRDKELAS